MFDGIQFPVYRKYLNNKHFFKIISPTSFEEIILIGNKKVVHLKNATQLPEFNHIHDLVFDKNVTLSIDEKEYLEMLNTA